MGHVFKGPWNIWKCEYHSFRLQEGMTWKFRSGLPKDFPFSAFPIHGSSSHQGTRFHQAGGELLSSIVSQEDQADRPDIPK